jgi:peptidoglycan hydrolase-like protein with peptidoglycan-binding domain
MIMALQRGAIWVLLLLSVAVAPACSRDSAADRAREAAEEIRQSIPNVDATALAQKAEAKTVREVQERLTQLKEYMGEINGDLDSVTVHAIQAFQRSAGLRDDGILDQETLDRLRAATDG